ncbi:MAG: aminoacyl-tRNA hydrolase [Hyphomicrobiaceae bacterium]
MKLLVGLGNPGTQYAGNRHNVGFMALERIADTNALSPWRKRFQGEALDGRIGSERILLLKPQTYMNESGRSVGEAARFLKINPQDVIVFYDEIDLAPGKLKVKTGGGNAGHNGLRSISAHLDNDYVRVRIGVGHPGRKDQVANYVLNNFAKAEHDWLDPLLDAIASATPNLLNNDAARFTADVALKLGGHALDKKPKRTKAEPKPSSSQSKPKSSPAKAGHPAGERAQKRKSALAENLQKWLAGQGDKKE